MIYYNFIIVFIVSYLLGSLSFAIIVSKSIYKKDIRTFGSGNAGMTNILRTFGKKAAALTISGDVLKGTFSVLFARMWASQYFLVSEGMAVAPYMKELLLYVAVIGAILGHLYPLYFGFKGGKGVSVLAGAMIAVTPVTLLLALSVFLVIAFTVKIVSLASIVACSSYFFITLGYFYFTNTFSVINLIAAILLPSMVIYSHRANIKRLLNGTEYKFKSNK